MPVRIVRDPIEPSLAGRLLTILDGASANPQQAGNAFAQLIGEEQGWGPVAERFRTRHGEIGRRWDFGNAKEITIEGRNEAFGSAKVDQFWVDLGENGRVDLTVPRLHADAERQLGRLAGEFQARTGREPLITVREVMP